MSSKKNKFMIVMLIAVLCLHLVSCRKTESADSVFCESTSFSYELPSGHVKNMVVSGGNHYWLVDAETAAGSRITLYSGDADGTELQEIDSEGKGYSIRAIAADGAGNVIECNNHADRSVIRKLDSDGNVLWMTEVDGEATAVGCSEKIVAVSVGTELLVLNQDGTEQSRIVLDESSCGSLLVLKDSRIYEKVETDAGAVVLISIDSDTQTVGEAVTLPEFAGDFVITAGVNTDLLLINSSLAAGYNIGDEEYSVIADFAYSSIMLENPYLYSMTEDGLLVVRDGSDEIRALMRSDEAGLKNKTVITVGMTAFNYDRGVRLVGDEIEAFNAENETYFVRLLSDSVYDMTELPDVVLMTGADELNSGWADSAKLENLYTWIDADAELGREDFLSNVLESGEMDGNLYGILTRFQVDTLMGMTSVVGEEPGWTVAEALQTADKYPDSWMFSFLSGSELLRNCLQYGVSAANLDAESLAQLMEWTAAPSAYDANTSADDSAEERWAAWSKLNLAAGEDVLLEPVTLGAFSDFTSLRGDDTYNGTDWGGELTFIGYPTQVGNGAAASGDICLAMSADSKNKDAAWQFIRQYLTYDWQINHTSSAAGSEYFPVRLDALETLAGEAADSEKYGEATLTQEEIDSAIAYLKTVSCSGLDEQTIEIIIEEAEKFYAGEQTAEDAAAAVLDRLSR